MHARLRPLLPLVLILAGCAADDDDPAFDSEESNLTQATSAFTSLEQKDCKDLPSGGVPEVPIFRQRCDGMGGFDLLVEENDLRVDVTVHIGAKKMDLGVSRRLPAFSHLGPTADWRGRFVAPGKVAPYAVIFRYFQFEPSGRETSFLVVARVSKDASCIVDIVPGSEPNHNEKAHRIADANRNATCK